MQKELEGGGGGREERTEKMKERFKRLESS